MAAVFKVRHCTCASRHSTFRLPSALRAVKGCHPPCDFQSTASTLRVSAACIRVAPCRLKPLSHDAGHVFAFAGGIRCANGPIYFDERVLWLRDLLDHPMPLTEYLSPAGYSTDLQDRVRALSQARIRFLSICTTALACRLGRWRYPFPSRLACWFALDPGTTRSVPRPRFPAVSRGPVDRDCFPAPCFTIIPGRSPETPPGGREDRLAWLDPQLRGRRSVEIRLSRPCGQVAPCRP